jgi:hypothetical protein
MLWLLIVILVVGVAMEVLPVDAEAKRLVRVGLIVLFIVWLVLLLFGGFEFTGPPFRRTVIVH